MAPDGNPRKTNVTLRVIGVAEIDTFSSFVRINNQ